MNVQNSPAKKPYEIVVGFDFSELAERALAEAIDVAARHTSAELNVVTAAMPVGSLIRLPNDSESRTDEEARKMVERRIASLIEESQARRGPLTVTRVAIYVIAGLDTQPGRVISDLAQTVDADLIVVGTHGRRGFARLLLGSVAEQVVREARTTVLVVRPPDFVGGRKVPAIEPPLAPGQPHLKPFHHHRTYHSLDRAAQSTDRTMPAV
jgi:nucleotide-binding universal stress UspA family protein